jgi:Ribbon-helix-helix protein, copG family
MAPRKRYSFWINDRQAAGLKAIRAAEDISESEQIRQALNEWLKKKGLDLRARAAARKPR